MRPIESIRYVLWPLGGHEPIKVCPTVIILAYISKEIKLYTSLKHFGLDNQQEEITIVSHVTYLRSNSNYNKLQVYVFLCTTM